MQDDTTLSLINTLFSAISGKLFTAHAALDQLRYCENLSPAGFLSVKTINLCHMYMNRICQLTDYLTNKDSLPELLSTNSFDSEQLMAEITSVFSTTISGFSSVTASFCSKLDRPFPIQINKTKFETVMLNLLYCFMKTDFPSEDKKTKINLSVSETKKNIVFHIRTNSIVENTSKLEQLLTTPRTLLPDSHSEDTVLALSLEVASKFVKESKGKLSYKTLKNSCRFDIALPKFPSVSESSLRAPQRYFPNLKNFNETFAELELLYFSQNQQKDLLKV